MAGLANRFREIETKADSISQALKTTLLTLNTLAQLEELEAVTTSMHAEALDWVDWASGDHPAASEGK